MRWHRDRATREVDRLNMLADTLDHQSAGQLRSIAASLGLEIVSIVSAGREIAHSASVIKEDCYVDTHN